MPAVMFLLVLKLLFRYRLFCAAFAILGIAATAAILTNGMPTATGFLLMILTAFAVKRVLR